MKVRSDQSSTGTEESKREIAEGGVGVTEHEFRGEHDTLI